MGRYRVDELNHKRKLIVEINGDAVHGNPRKFSAHDKLLYGKTADWKWTRDCKRQTYLERKGYRVIVIWESDNPWEKARLIRTVLRLYH